MNANYQNITFAFSIESQADLDILAKNPLFQANENYLVASYIENLESLPEEKVLKLSPENSGQAISALLKKIKTPWLLYLRVEEYLDFLEVQYLEPSAYYVQVETLSKNSIDRENLLVYEMRLFHKNMKKIVANNFAPVNVLSRLNFFPEIASTKLNSCIEKFKNGDNSFNTIIYLLEKNYHELDVELISNKIDFYYENLVKKDDILKLYHLLSEHYLKTEHLEQAEKIAIKGLELFQTSPNLNYSLGLIYLKQELFEKAEHYFKYVIELGKTKNYYHFHNFMKGLMSSIAYYNLGELNFKKQDFLASKIAFEAALEIESDFAEARTALALAEKAYQESENYINENDFFCNSCASCCHTFKVEVTPSDVQRILDNRKDLKIEDFLKYTDKRIISNQNISLVLKEKENSSACIFLENNKCSIHEFKPKVCRVWPFGLKKSGTIDWANQYREFIKNKCHYTLVKNANDPQDLRELVESHTNEVKAFKNTIKEWTSKPDSRSRSFNDFLAFLNLR